MRYCQPPFNPGTTVGPHNPHATSATCFEYLAPCGSRRLGSKFSCGDYHWCWISLASVLLILIPRRSYVCLSPQMHHQLAGRSNLSEYLTHFFPDVRSSWNGWPAVLFLQYFPQVNEWHSQKKMQIITVCIYETERWSLIGETAEHNWLVRAIFIWQQKCRAAQQLQTQPAVSSQLWWEQTCRCCTTSVQQSSRLQESRLCPMSNPSLTSQLSQKLKSALFILFCKILSPQLCPSLWQFGSTALGEMGLCPRIPCGCSQLSQWPSLVYARSLKATAYWPRLGLPGCHIDLAQDGPSSPLVHQLLGSCCRARDGRTLDPVDHSADPSALCAVAVHQCSQWGTSQTGEQTWITCLWTDRTDDGRHRVNRWVRSSWKVTWAKATSVVALTGHSGHNVTSGEVTQGAEMGA